jgi:protein tyrosine/serine phosphatase
MSKSWAERLKDLERKVRTSFGDDLSTPAKRRQAFWHYHLFDHAFLRTFWTNFYELAPGVYRSNQPVHARWVKYKEKFGLKTVINLRGKDDFSPYLFERESLEQLDIELIDAKIYARRTASREELLFLIETLKTAQRPMLFHCKSGADRAGFTAALYMLVIEGKPLAEARKQLSWKYLHLRSTMTGAVDYVFDQYEIDTKGTDIGFEQWVRDTYEKKAVMANFMKSRGSA